MGEPRADPGAVEDAFRGATGREWLLRCLPARAHDNGMFIVFSNGVGRDDDEVRTGNAMLVDPYGRIIAETLAITDDMVAADLDLDQATASAGQWWLRVPPRRSSTARWSARPATWTPLPPGKPFAASGIERYLSIGQQQAPGPDSFPSRYDGDTLSVRITPLTDPEPSPSSHRLAWLASDADGNPVGTAFLRLFTRPGRSTWPNWTSTSTRPSGAAASAAGCSTRP